MPKTEMIFFSNNFKYFSRLSIDHIKKNLITNSIVKNKVSLWYMVFWGIFREKPDFARVMTVFTTQLFAASHFENRKKCFVKNRENNVFFGNFGPKILKDLGSSRSQITIYHNEKLLFTIELSGVSLYIMVIRPF